jgi:hypothetical protein
VKCKLSDKKLFQNSETDTLLSMPSAQSESLFFLICSLTKAEKRAFKLYARRSGPDGDVKFVRLFDLLDEQTEYDEAMLLRKMPDLTSVALVNLRRQLYDHLLSSLRLVQVNTDPVLQINELIDFAHIVYGRGLYMQALKLLGRAKELARRRHQDVQHLGIVEFEKQIQSRYITRATSAQMAELTSEAQQRSLITGRLTQLTNLKLRLQRYFILHGHAKDSTARDFVREALGGMALDSDYGRGTFFERVYFCEAAFWQGYICLDFVQSTTAARQWLSCYEQQPSMIADDPDLYLRALHHLLHSSWFANQLTVECAVPLQAIADFAAQPDNPSDARTLRLAEWYRYLWQTNVHLAHERYRAVVQEAPAIRQYLNATEMYLDSHKRHLLWYKLAAAHLADGQPGEAIALLNQIVHKGDWLREDIDVYTRLLMLMAHYELGNFDLLSSLTDAVGRIVAKIQDPPVMQTALLRFFRAAARPNTRPADNYRQLMQALEPHQNSPAERRGFIYLDGYAWAKRKL